MMQSIFRLPNMGNLSPSLGLGAIGMPGYILFNYLHSSIKSQHFNSLHLETRPTLDS